MASLSGSCRWSYHHDSYQYKYHNFNTIGILAKTIPIGPLIGMLGVGATDLTLVWVRLEPGGIKKPRWSGAVMANWPGNKLYQTLPPTNRVTHPVLLYHCWPSRFDQA
jgi:hypothetical protein